MANVKQDIEKLNFEKVWLMFQETDRKFQETKELLAKSSLETNKQIEELGRQIGGLHNKFGAYNESLVIPSIKKILENEFNCNYKGPNIELKQNGDTYEIDLLGTSQEACYLVEIKSKLNLEAIAQLKKIIEKFRKYMPEYSNKKIFGILAVTQYNDDQYKKALKEGFYIISISDNLAMLHVPEKFKPKSW
jgi:hypothetical protein